MKNNILTIVGLNPKYSARPPHTPDITLFVLDLYNILLIQSPPLINILNLLIEKTTLLS